MCEVVLEISHGPFGEEKTFAAFYAGKVCVHSALMVTVVLRGDGVFSGIAGQKDAQRNINLPPTEPNLQEMLDLDIRVLADENSMELRGLTEADLMPGIEVAPTKDIHDMIIGQGSIVLTF